MLAIEVEFLSGRVYAADRKNGEDAEWPPHPARLFHALVAAYEADWRTESARTALEWLERQSAPHINASESGRLCEAYKAFVPSNYGKGNQPRFFPVCTPADARVWFIWPEAAPAAGTRQALEELCGRVPYVGRSPSFARVALCDSPPLANLAPSASGDYQFRVPAPGRLSELEDLYAAEIWDTSCQRQTYTVVTKPVEHPRGPWDDLIIMARLAGRRIPIEGTLTLTCAFRDALLRLSGDRGVIPEALHGHGRHPHCSFAAFPFTGSHYADGSLMGVGILIPRNATISDRRSIRATARALTLLNLGGSLGVWKIEEVEPEAAPDNLKLTAWTGPARRWGSVTPILLDRFPKPGKIAAEDIIALSCDRIGLPTPKDIEQGPYAAIAGVPPAGAFRVKRQHDDKPVWAVHATVEFDTEVEGPILLGAGRYFGLGLMRPLRGQHT